MLKVRRKKLGSVSILDFEGCIVNGLEIDVLRTSVSIEIDTSVVVLDLARVQLIDAGGLGTLLELREWTQSKGIEFRLTNVNKLVREVLEIACLDSVFRICDEAPTTDETSRIASDLESVRAEVLKRRLHSLRQNYRSVIVRSLIAGGRYLPQVLWSDREKLLQLRVGPCLDH